MSDAILSFLTEQGYIGVFFLMVLENVFPPIPSEVILPFIGHLAATGVLNFWLALVVATLGSVCGTSIWFAAGWWVGTPRLMRFFRRFGGYVAISESDFASATKYFTKYQLPAVFFGRMIPAVRSVISIPAGCVRMKFSVFLLYSTLGAFTWNTLLISLGYFVLDDYTIVDTYMNPIADIIIYLFLGAYVAQVLRFMWRKYALGEQHP
jgi:membrane protein DedA with SNARE-associated domain